MHRSRAQARAAYEGPLPMLRDARPLHATRHVSRHRRRRVHRQPPRRPAARGRERAVTVVDDFNDYYDPALKRANVAAHLGTAATASSRPTSATRRASPRSSRRARRRDRAPRGARAACGPRCADPLLYETTTSRARSTCSRRPARTASARFVFASSSSVYGAQPRGAVPRGRRAAARRRPTRRPRSRARRCATPTARLTASDRVAALLHRLRAPAAARPRDPQVRRADAGRRGHPALRRRLDERATTRSSTTSRRRRGGARARRDRLRGVQPRQLQRPSRSASSSRRSSARSASTARIEWLPDQPGDVQTTYADVTRARERLGFRPGTPLEDGLAVFARWLRERR